jgi:mono/diheme cytochrome c family protein
MGLEVLPSEGELAALSDFLDRVPLPSQRRVLDSAAVERGRVLFDAPEVACASCHAGERFTDNAPYDVGPGELLITPPLVRVVERAPFMHDGCAQTLLARFSPCGGGDQHGKTSHLSPEQLSDLTAFLESL